MSKINFIIRRVFSCMSISAIFLSSLIISPSVSAAIAATDHFVLTAAGGATSVEAGSNLTFTIGAFDGSSTAKSFTGQDKICIDIIDPTTFMHSTNADVNAVLGMTLSVTDYSNGGANPTYPLQSGLDIDLGTNNNIVCFNTTAAGDAITNTFTVRATSSYNIYVHANGAAVNDDTPTYLGQDFANITVTAAVGDPDHLVASFGAQNSSEVGEQKTLTISQVNAGGTLKTNPLNDVMVDLSISILNSGTQSDYLKSSASHGLVLNDVVKFTSVLDPTPYFIVSDVGGLDTFKVTGTGFDTEAVFSNSNVAKVTSMADGAAVALDEPGSVVTANTASTVNTADGTTLSEGDIVKLAGCAGVYSVVSTVDAGADSTVTVVGPTACTTGAGNITKQTLTPGSASAYTVKNATLASGYFYSVGGTLTGNETTTYISGKSLTDGVLSTVVVGTTAGTLIAMPFSMTLQGMPNEGTLTVGDLTTLQITGYGPPSGAPTNAPIDIFMSKNPSGGNVAFPLRNAADSAISITAGGTPVAGTWQSFPEMFGETTVYRAVFAPTNPLQTSTYTVSILKTLAVGGTDLPVGVTALTNSGSAYTYTFTTGLSGGTFTAANGTAPGGIGGGFTGTFGGDVPPMAMLGYPRPQSWDVPTNITKITIDFDRDMDATTFTNSNIYLKKMVSGAETPAGVTTTVSPTTGTSKSAYMTISGGALSTSSEYRVVVTRNVKDTKGKQIGGMPVDEDNNPLQGFGFGFDNMGPFKESFNTGTVTNASITSTFMGTNLDRYKSGNSITGVPTSMRIKAAFDKPLDPSTVSLSNISLKIGSTPVFGTVSYDGQSNAIEFVPTNILLASTTYSFGISTGVLSVTGNAVISTTKTFTTGLTDATGPEIAFADADNYGLRVQFNEPMNSSKAENKNYWTLKTCSEQLVAPDGVKCYDNTTDPTAVSLTSANLHYDQFDNTLRIDGLTLTEGNGFYITATADVKDAANNVINPAFDTWTGKIMDAGNFQGGQGMSTMANLEMKDFNMTTMGMTPIFAGPMNSMAGATTKYFIRFPVESAIPTGGWMEFTFPTGFTVTGVKQDAQSPMKSDFNGPASGTPKFATNLTNVFPIPTDGADAQANDGVGYITLANKVYVKLDGASNSRDFLQIDLDGIVNSNEPKDPSTSGYSVQIKTYDTTGTLLEAMQSMPFYISSGGTGNLSGHVRTPANPIATGLNGVKVYLYSPFTGPMETTTQDGGVIPEPGYYSFSNLPSGQYMISTEPVFTVGLTTYTGKMSQEPVTVIAATTKNFTVTEQNINSNARQPVTISYPNGINTITNLGFNDSIDIFAGGPNGFVVKTVPRADLAAAGISYTTTMYLPSAGNWMIGVGPSMPKGPMAGKSPQIDWMPTQPTNVDILTTDISGDIKPAISFTLTTADKTISGKTVDASGTAIPNVEVYAYNPKGGIGSHTTADSLGIFTLKVTEGTYKVGAFMPGMPSSTESSILVDDFVFYVNGSSTASTGSSGENPFNIKIAKTSITIQGRVSTGSSAIANAAVWAHRTDSPMPPIHAQTDSTGNFTLYVTAGTWKVESDAPGYGYLGSKTLTVTTSSLTSQDFEVAAGQGSITGTINYAGPTPAEGVIVTAYGAGGINETKTDSSGAYTLSLPISVSPYTLKAFAPGIGNVSQQPITVDGDEVVAPITIDTQRSVTIDIATPGSDPETVSDDILITFKDTDGNGNELVIPAGSSSGTISIPSGTYYMETSIPGVNPSALTFYGGEHNNVNGTPSTDNTVNFDGDGDDMGIMLPALYTISGRNPQSLDGISVKVMDTVSKKSFSVVTSLNGAGGGLGGEYLFKAPAGTYTLTMSKTGYISTSIDVVVAGNSTGNDLALYPLATRTVTGSVKVGDTGISGAKVYAEITGGGVATTSTESDGTYTLPLKEGVWTISASADGYEGAVPLVVDVSTLSATGKDFTVTALTGGDALSEPQTESVTPANGGIINDTDTNTEIIVPPNALGSETDAGQMTVQETNEIFSTPSANPVGNAQEIKAIDANGNPINTLDDAVTIVLQRSLAELVAEGIDTPAESDGMTTAYWDETTSEWIPQSTTLEYHSADGAVIPRNTVDAGETLAAAGVDFVKFTSQTDHFTTFAPIVSSGATPPATPTGLAATAGNTQVVLTWNKNSEEDMSRYDIWEANVTEGVLTTLTQVACATTPCTKTITGLTNGTAYSFQIIAVDTDENSSAGSTAAAATPTAPAEVVATPSGGGGGSPLITKKKTTVAPETPKTDTTTESTTTQEKPSKTPLKDIAGHWAQTYIEDLYEKEIVSGDKDNNYNPNKPITRAEFTKIVVGMYNIPMQDLGSVVSSFKDVKTSEWYAVYIQAAYDKGIIEGYSKNTFNPNKPITRAEAMKVILLASGKNILLHTDEVGIFKDVSATDWFAKYATYAALNGIIDGYEDGTFGPNKPITRAEVAKISDMILKVNLVGIVMNSLKN